MEERVLCPISLVRPAEELRLARVYCNFRARLSKFVVPFEQRVESTCTGVNAEGYGEKVDCRGADVKQDRSTCVLWIETQKLWSKLL